MKKELNSVSINSNQATQITRKRPILALVVFAGMFVVGAPLKGQDQQCSNASLRGSYGFLGFGTVVPAGTPRAVIGVFSFDGRGGWTANLKINDNGTITVPPPLGRLGTYIVNADCTGTLFPSIGGSVAIVVVDNGGEVYQMRTDPSTIVVHGVTKKLFPGDK